MLRPLYNWTMQLAAHPRALGALAAVSFIESSFFPIPPDVLLIAMVIAARDRAWVIAGVCTIASILGGLFGYAIGYFLFEEVGRPIIELYGYGDKFEAFRSLYNEWGFWIVFGGGFTPVPYKVITVASGVTHLDLIVFTIASAVSRGARFFLVAALLWYFGPPIRSFIDKNLWWVAIGGFLAALGGFLALRYLL